MANIEYEILYDDVKDDKSELILKGDLSIDNAAGIYEDLLPKVSASELHCIRVRNATNIDLTVLQVLVAIRKTKLEIQPGFQIICELDSQFQELIENAGIVDVLGIANEV